MAQVHGLSSEREQLKACMGVNKGWPFPAQRDGWCMAHHALRLDMRDFKAALATLLAQCAAGKALSAWQVKILQESWKSFSEKLHMHHNTEEKVAFPFISKKATMPPKLSADHTEIVDSMNACTAQVNMLSSVTAAVPQAMAMGTLIKAFDALDVPCREHMAEEEETALPLLRHNFTHKTSAPMIAEILKDATPEDLAWVVSSLPSDAAKVAWMKEVPSIPAPVIWLIMMPAVRKYKRNHAAPLRALIAGETVYKPQPAGCACFGAHAAGGKTL